MLVIPALSYLLVGMALYMVGQKIGKPFLAAFLYFVLTLSTSVNRWMVSDLTDGLLVAIISLIYLSVFYSRLKTPLIVFITLALLTRPSGPLLVALLLPFALAYRRISIYLGIAISVFGTLILAYVSPEAAGTQTSGEYTVYQRIQDFALHGIKVLVVEFGQLFVMDRILFVFIVVAIATALLTWKNVYSRSFLALLVACFAMGAWNGALGVNFRYQLPLIFAAALVIIFSVDDLKDQLRRLKLNPHQN
jgi:putative Ca2+/H+ antiporter (TMEM165/GDT1 family)